MASESRVAALETVIEEMRKTIADLKKEKKTDPGALTSKRSFLNVPKNSGVLAEYEDWRFKLLTFLAEEQCWKEVLALMDKMMEKPGQKEFEEVNRVLREEQNMSHLFDLEGTALLTMSQQIYQVLCMNLTGEPLKPIRNLWDEKWAGWIGWWRVSQDQLQMTAERLQGLAAKVYSPARVKKYADVLGAIESWEEKVRIYEGHEKKKLADPTKIYGLRKIVPEELEKDMIRQTNNLKEYEAAKSYVVEQVTIRRDSRASGPVPMEVDLMSKMVAMLKGDESKESERTEEGGEEEECGVCGDHEPEGPTEKLHEIMSFMNKFNGKGDGNKGGAKGGWNGNGKGGKFDGYCSHCGLYGHRLRECWKKDKEMEEWRKGKGKGKGGFQGKGGYQGQQGKGGWKGGGSQGKGYGKGHEGKGGKAMGLDHWGYGNQGAWTLSMLVNKEKDSKWEVPSRPARQVGQPVSPPPGLAGGFEVLRSQDMGEEYEEMFPQVNQAPNGSTSKAKMPPMGNYSKGQVRRSQGIEGPRRWKPRKEEEKKGKKLFMLQKAQEQKTLNPFMAPTPDAEGWIRVKGVMDSGASESVAPPTMCPHYPIQESPGSRAGQKYLSASDDEIPNLGEQFLSIVTDDYAEGVAHYQVADVSRPLNAVSEICDAGGDLGQQVTFTKYGGTILNLSTGKETHFGREEGVYVWEFWVKPRQEGGFTRRGF